MYKLHSTILLLFFLASLSENFCANHNSRLYRDLYGFEDKKMPKLESFASLTAGGLKFIREINEFSANELPDITPSFDQEYDFIVVGAGSAGATIASRLSEVKDFTVLLIEAGDNENLIMDIPMVAYNLEPINQMTWKYQTEFSKNYCRGMTNKRCNWSEGKVMGGTSSMNHFAAIRGNPRDYDGWAAMGNEGWSYSEVLKYFKKLETIDIDDLKEDEEFHSTNGPLQIVYSPFRTPLAESFIQAGIEMGYPIIDHNSNRSIGFSYIQVTMKDGMRVSTNRAYLHPANKRKNLFVSKLSHVTKVLIDPNTRRAFGVNFMKKNSYVRVRARKEIILSAGAINSAQILMLSGIGPADHLKHMKIEVIQDSPVGENLMDNVFYGGLIFLVDQPVSLVTSKILDKSKSYLSDFLLKRTGPITSSAALEALAFIDLDNPDDFNAYPNIELLFLGGSIVSDNIFHINYGISDEYWNKMFSQIYQKETWTIAPILMRSKSRGKILLRSTDPMAKPKIFANYLNDTDDVRILIKGIRAAIKLSRTKAMQKFGSRLHDVLVPGCEDYEYDSDKYWECAIRTFTFTLYQHSGTCKMAPKDDPTGVVNPKLQVKGIKGLRVAGAPIMPSIITGHINIPVIMIGEKLSDMVKEHWGYDTRTNKKKKSI